MLVDRYIAHLYVKIYSTSCAHLVSEIWKPTFGGIDSLRFASLWLPGSLHYVRVDILDRGGAPPAPPLLLHRELDHVS